ncbi:ParA family protein [Gluconobacter cerinus]|uniref:ParA family protein n=1 Tax=Gluconobacter cerinus TaxID=38307 RepID=UPI001C04A0FE
MSNDNVEIFCFYNNKGGVGKTTLCQNAASLYAEQNKDEIVLVIDLCPQANISQFLLGGGHKGYGINQRIQNQSSRKNIVGFMDWLLAGNSGFTSTPTSYMINPYVWNKKIPENIYLIAGDSFLESQALALNFATMNPGNINAWKEFVTAIRRLCVQELHKSKFSTMKVFIDCNPSFSIYTQMALVSSDHIIIPAMADFSSLEGIKGILMLLYGKYPSSAVRNYASKVLTFNRQISNFGLSLPKIFEIAFNNFTSNLGIATAYASVKDEIAQFCWDQYVNDPNIFAGSGTISDKLIFERTFFSQVKDFHTAGRVSATLGIPLYRLPEHTNYKMPDGVTDVVCPRNRYQECLDHLHSFVDKL